MKVQNLVPIEEAHLGLGLRTMTTRSWFLLRRLVKFILVGLGNIVFANGLGRIVLDNRIGSVAFGNGKDCSGIIANPAVYGFSHNCSSFSLAGDDKLRNVMPSGDDVSFNITTFVLECAGYECLTMRKRCTLACPCCKQYSGPDPGFHATIRAPGNETSVYMQNLNCTIPPYVPDATGFYFFTCKFSGYGMANTSKLVQIRLSWDKLYGTFQPYLLGVYIIAGSVSLPDCIWQWERGNKFPLNEYGVFRILLYDGFGNKISAATGGTDRSIVAMDVQLRRYGTFGNESTGELRLDVHTTWKLTYQVQYGFCVITVYCTSVGKYQLKVIDEHNRALGSTPATFYVMPDEAWTGTKFIPPPAPRTFFLGDNSKDKAKAGVTADNGLENGIAPAHLTVNLLLLLPILFVVFCLLYSVFSNVPNFV